jgi:hypothetical protein
MLPNLLVIGAMKCGTTSLHRYLASHPQISMCRDKELEFFVEERAWSRGLPWYEARFPPKPGARVYGESSPLYTAFPRWKGVPERMHGVVPDAKLIYLVRDPIDRLVSHYVHDYADGFEDRPPGEALADLEGKYVWGSRYFMQLEQYLPYFPPERILIVEREELLGERRPTLRRLFEFLGVDPGFESPAFDAIEHETRHKRRRPWLTRRLALSWRVRHHVARHLAPRTRARLERSLSAPFAAPIARPEVTAAQRRRLGDVLAPDAARFRAFTGRAFAHWTV